MGGQYPKDMVAPHPFKAADTAYENMCKFQKAQCFIIRYGPHRRTARRRRAPALASGAGSRW